MNNHWNRSIGLISTALTLSAVSPGAVRSGDARSRPVPAQGGVSVLTVRPGGGAHPALLTEADRRRMRLRTALFTDQDRQLTVMRTALFTPQDQQRVTVRSAAFNPGDPPIAVRPSAAGPSGR